MKNYTTKDVLDLLFNAIDIDELEDTIDALTFCIRGTEDDAPVSVTLSMICDKLALIYHNYESLRISLQSEVDSEEIS